MIAPCRRPSAPSYPGSARRAVVSRLCSGCASCAGSCRALRAGGAGAGGSSLAGPPVAISRPPFSEGPQTRARILDTTGWDIPAVFSREARGDLSPGRRRMGALQVGGGSAPRALQLVCSGFASRNAKLPYTRDWASREPSRTHIHI